MPDSPERILAGRYRLLEALGRGGMGIVWRARDEYLHRDVAVKEITLPRGLAEADRAGLLERFIREARAAARLDHPAIISVYDVIAENDLPWIVMRLVRGRSLDQLVRDEGALPPERVAAIGLQVLDALGAAHAEEILHRDVTPRNVLVGDDGRIVLTDFGIASIDGAAALTQTGALIGSPGYIAPERLRGRLAGPESDLWSLGATLYLAVEGRRAYSANETPVLIGMVLSEAPGPVHHAGPLKPVLEGLLVKEPAERMTAEDARLQLRAVVAGHHAVRQERTDRTTADPAPGTSPSHSAPTPNGPTANNMSRPYEPTLPVSTPGPNAYGPMPGANTHPGRPHWQNQAPNAPQHATPSAAGFGPARPGRRGGSRVMALLLIPGLVMLVVVAGIAVNVIWNPLHIVSEGEFTKVPACAGVAPATLDTLVGRSRHAVEGHCEWWSLSNAHEDFQVLSATRYTRSGWTSAEDRAHSAMNDARSGAAIEQTHIGDEAASDDSGDGTVVWFRTSNVVVKVLYTSQLDRPGTTFKATQAAREMVRTLAGQR
jgi:serine/threonine protein kinase